MITSIAIFILLATIFLIWRGMEVRLILCLSGLALGAITGKAYLVVQKFIITLADEKFVVPICCSMGFAYVLKLTGCDAHLVQLLARPIRKVHWLLLPGSVLIGVIVNIPIISQASTCMAVGTVLVPLLRSAGMHPVLIGACLLLGSSMGGELLNPGAPELNTVADALKIKPQQCVGAILPLLIIQVIVVISLFWFNNRKNAFDKSHVEPLPDDFRINYWKAMIPLIPLLLLLITTKPTDVIHIPEHWLTDKSFYSSRLIGLAMLVGVVIAAMSSPRHLNQSMMEFFSGAGYAFTHIISIIAAANAFGKGIELTSLAHGIGDVVHQVPWLLHPLAALVPYGFALLSGSGMASTQSLFQFFIEPSERIHADPIQTGALVSISAAAGRTMSVVAAVAYLSAALTGSTPGALVKRIALPLFIGVIVLVLVTTIRHWLIG